MNSALRAIENLMRDLALYTEHVTITTERRYEILDITETVERVRAAAGGRRNGRNRFARSQP